MTDGDRIVAGVMVVLGFNHLLFRFPGWDQRRALFWGVQAVEAAGAVAAVALLPSLNPQTRMLNWVLGLLLVYHVLTNHFRLQRAARAREHHARMAEERRQERREAAEAALPAEDPPQPPG